MNEENGKGKNLNNLPSNKSTNVFTEIPIDIINEKFNEGKLNIEDLLENDECINDLIMNINSKFKKIITIKNINKLIDFSLKFHSNLNEKSKKDIRYSYYSCQILCSQNVLIFKNSIKNLKLSNNLKKKSEKSKDSLKNNQINNNIINENIDEEENIDKEDEPNDINQINEEIYDQANQFNNNLDYGERNFSEFSQILNDYENEVDEKYVDLYKIQMTETEMKKKTIMNNNFTQFEGEEKDIINNILNKIFEILDLKTNNNEENETYMGYFQKIVNFLLINESDIIIQYLFKDSSTNIKKFYIYLDKAAIQNILENLLNILSDKEDLDKGDKDSKYSQIIQQLIEHLSEDKAEFICELIIHTLINNSEKQLIEIIFKNNKMMKKLKALIKDIINKKSNNNNEKILINILHLLCQLNYTIIKSFNESSLNKYNKKDIDINLNYNKKINTFEYQYISQKIISNKNIFEAFKDNRFYYFLIMNDIYSLILIDIKQNYKNRNKKNNNNNSKNKNYNKNNKEFGLNNIYKWNYILNILQLYIYSYYAIENFNIEKNEYFSLEGIFNISIKLYFNFQQNNFFQKIFTGIIKLICSERCPSYLVNSFLEINGENGQIKLLSKIINKLKKYNENGKNNLLILNHIEILKLFYSSNNPTILRHFKECNLDNIYKNIFNESIIPKLERQLGENDEFSNSEIFNSDDDEENTFDGNNIEIKREIWTIKKIIDRFFYKFQKITKDSNEENVDKNNDINNNNIKKDEENKILKQTQYMNVDNIFNNVKYTIKKKQEISESQNEENNNFELKRETEYSLEEEDII